MTDTQTFSVSTAKDAKRIWFTRSLAVRVLACVELIIFTISSLLSRILPANGSSFGSEDLAVGLLAGALFILVGRQIGLYRLDSLTSLVQSGRNLFVTITASVFAVVVFYFLMKTSSDHSRLAFTSFFFLTTAGVFAARAAASLAVNRALASGAMRGRRVVIIADRSQLRALTPKEALHYGIQEIARFELNNKSSALGDDGRQLVMRAIEFARRTQAAEFALMLDWRADPLIDETLALLQESPLSVRLYPDRRTRDILQKHRGGPLNPYLSIELQREPLRWAERAVKRSFDIAAAFSGLLLLSPLLVLTALLIKIDSPGPAMFRQRRMGFDKRAFTIFKFRTMSVLEDGDVIRQAQKGDDRITRLGRWLRRTSIDELPQLLNVLKGDMSLVGPRPHALAHDIEYSRKIFEYARRHHVKPGLTGAAQVRGFRGETRTVKQMHQRVEWDLWYINNWSFLLDIKIIAQTCFSIITHKAF